MMMWGVVMPDDQEDPVYRFTVSMTVLASGQSCYIGSYSQHADNLQFFCLQHPVGCQTQQTGCSMLHP